MKNFFYSVLLYLLLLSCDSSRPARAISNLQPPKDTTITYRFKTVIQSYNNGAQAFYINGKIEKCVIYLYGGESGHSEQVYIFRNDHIEITRQFCNYKFDDLKNQDPEMSETEKELDCSIDYKGAVITPDPFEQKKYYNVFRKLKKVVPFELK